MVVSHNMEAMNSQRQLKINTGKKAKTAEKLSTGYRINRASDDAAGLEISEKMRWQARGLNKGMSNIDEGIKFCQVADGAMAEVNDMLHRITELSVQAANDTNTYEDRASINREVQQLMADINRIKTSTKYNDQNVFADGTGQIAPADDPFYKIDTPTATSTFFKVMKDHVSTTGYMQQELTYDFIQNECQNTGAHTGDGKNSYVGVEIDFGDLIKPDPNNNITKLIDTGFYVNCCTNCCPNKVTFADTAGITRDQDVVTIGLKKADGSYFTDAEEFIKSIIDAKGVSNDSHVEYAYKQGEKKLYIYDIDNNHWSEQNKKWAYFCDVPANFTNPYQPVPNTNYEVMTSELLHIQMGAKGMQGMSIRKVDISTDVLHLTGKDCLTQENSEELISAARYAGEELSKRRSLMGAYTNRLEAGYKVNANTVENTTSAESRIRDTDMAKEVVLHSITNILEQAGTSMLAQANQNQDSVLRILGQ